MSMRDEAMQTQKEKHRRRALIFNVLFMAFALVFIAFLLVMATHWPQTLVDEKGVRGVWNATVETEWSTISIAHSLDLSGGTAMAWSVNKGPDNETVEEGLHTNEDDPLIIVDLGEAGEYTVYMDPGGRNDARPYDVRIREHYIDPATVKIIYIIAAAAFAFVVGVIGLVFLYGDRQKFYEEYKITWWVTGPMLGVSSIIVLILPWL